MQIRKKKEVFNVFLNIFFISISVYFKQPIFYYFISVLGLFR